MKKLLKKIIIFFAEYGENSSDYCQYTLYHGMH